VATPWVEPHRRRPNAQATRTDTHDSVGERCAANAHPPKGQVASSFADALNLSGKADNRVPFHLQGAGDAFHGAPFV
jgi:hypothetical protein